MKRHILTICFALLTVTMALGQNAIVEGYAFETGNRGYLREVKITVYNKAKAIKAETGTNAEGFFTVEIPIGAEYTIKASKSIFEDSYHTIKADALQAGETYYVKMEIARKPGYLFDVTLADAFFDSEGVKNGIDSAKIEIYNNTTNEEVLVLEKHPFPNFTYTFEQGNFYTVMIRKEGYFTKRMEAHVNIDGCILCFEGMGNVRPSDNLTEGNKMGSLIANVEMDKIRLSQSIRVENIYYDYNKSNIRQDAAVELDKVIAMMKDNPNLIIELGSHTDARGMDDYNLRLSEQRAKSAVAYVMGQGNIPAERIKARGYGESSITNRCVNGVNCDDAEHEQNRRTTIAVIGFTEDDPYQEMSLRDIIYQENLEKATFSDSETFEYVEGGDLPEEIKKDLERQKQRELERAKVEATNANPVVEKTETEVASVRTPNVTKTTIENEEMLASKSGETEKPPATEPKTSTPPKKTEAKVVIRPTKKQIKNKKKGAFGEVVESKKKAPIEEAIPEPVLKATQIPSDYNGYMIEFFNSNIELSKGHSIFKQYGQIKVEKKVGGEYAYLISGFNTANEASSYLEKIIIQRFPAAKVIRYENGERVIE